MKNRESIQNLMDFAYNDVIGADYPFTVQQLSRELIELIEPTELKPELYNTILDKANSLENDYYFREIKDVVNELNSQLYNSGYDIESSNTIKFHAPEWSNQLSVDDFENQYWYQQLQNIREFNSINAQNPLNPTQEIEKIIQSIAYETELSAEFKSKNIDYFIINNISKSEDLTTIDIELRTKSNEEYLNCQVKYDNHHNKIADLSYSRCEINLDSEINQIINMIDLIQNGQHMINGVPENDLYNKLEQFVGRTVPKFKKGISLLPKLKKGKRNNLLSKLKEKIILEAAKQIQAKLIEKTKQLHSEIKRKEPKELSQKQSSKIQFGI
jgi:hypothetical protein